MNNEKHVKALNDFLQGKSSVQDLHFLLSQLDDPGRWDKWAKEKWEEAENEIDVQIEKKMFSEIQKSIKQNQTISLRKIWNIAASLLIICLAASTFYLLVENKKEKESKNLVVKVDKGQKASVILPDSTLVWLNSDSELHYNSDFNRHERRVMLVGEAYFEVSRHPDCPFIVSSGGIDVKALGTSFNVKAYPDEQSVTTLLIEGKVLVESQAETVLLLPGQELDYNRDNGNLTKTTLPDTRIVTAWREDKFVLDENSLLEITNMLARQYNVRFEFEKETLKDYQYSGTVDNTSLPSILEMISLTSPVCYHLNDNVIVLSQNLHKKEVYDLE